LLVFIVLGLPLAACITLGRQMTEEEHNCCLRMAGLCQSSAMPGSHSCCQHPVSPQVVSVAKIRSSDFDATSVVVSLVALPLPCSMTRSRAQGYESPPESSLPTTSVLRI